MPRTYKRKTNRRNAKHKAQTLPVKFKPGCIDDLDRRTDLFKQLNPRRQAIIADLGGEAELSHIKRSLVDRYVWLEAVIQDIELGIAEGTVDKGDVMGRWFQGANALTGLAKTLGIERRANSHFWAGTTVEPSNGKT